MSCVMGLDLSCSGTGIVVLRDGQIVDALKCGYPLKNTERHKRLRRLLSICEAVISVARKHDVTDVVAEGYAYNMRGGNQNDLAEVHGAVKTQLALLGVSAICDMTASTARLAVLGRGRAPKGEKVKSWIRDVILAQGIPLPDDEDIRDAYVVAEAYRHFLAVSADKDKVKQWVRLW